jgi:hypothetical protein
MKHDTKILSTVYSLLNARISRLHTIRGVWWPVLSNRRATWPYLVTKRVKREVTSESVIQQVFEHRYLRSIEDRVLTPTSEASWIVPHKLCHCTAACRSLAAFRHHNLNLSLKYHLASLSLLQFSLYIG